MRRYGTPPRGFRGRFEQTDAARARYAEAAGILSSIPAAVAVPHDADDLVTLVRWCAANGMPLVPRAAGTGMPGGNIGSGIVVDLLTSFRRVGRIDAGRRRAQAEPGVTLAELNAGAAVHGLRFPVDPSSGARCTLGGMIANNAAGARSVRYGSTRAWVDGLELVLADGTRAELRRGEPPAEPRLAAMLAEIDAVIAPQRREILDAWPRVRKNSSGYALREYLQSGDAVDLLVGSEGTLAIITGTRLRLAPLPAARGLALLEFTDLEAAGAAVEQVIRLRPSTCEILDRTFLDLVREAEPGLDYHLRPGLEAVLLVEVEADDPAAVAAGLDAIARGAHGAADHVALATDLAQQQRFWELRRAASPIIGRRTDTRVSMQFIEDGVVPVHHLPEYLRELRRILATHQVPAVIFGHAGDGNLHVNPLVDVASPDWRATIASILADAADLVIRLGGTLAGEHGDGRIRAPLLESVWGAPMVARLRHIKDTFDPAGILNPGVVLPLPGQQALGAVRDYESVLHSRRLARRPAAGPPRPAPVGHPPLRSSAADDTLSS